MMENATLKRIVFLLTEPHPTVVGEKKRQQARLLSSLLLIAIPIIVLTWFTSDLLVIVAPAYISVIIWLAITYIGSRTRYYNVILVIAISGITLLPLAIWFFGTNWTSNDLPRLMTWIFVALVIGGLLTRPILVLIQGIVIISIMVIVVGGIFAVPFQNYDSHLGTAGIITFFVFLTSYMLDSYFMQLDTRRLELNRQHGELEVYTQLLSHDLRNDLQGLIYSLENAELMRDIGSDKVQEAITQSQKLGERMAQLLNIFSMPLENPATDLVQHIENVAVVAQKSHENLSIQIKATDEARNQRFTAGRLLSLVWTNIFRNASQYSGSQTAVVVDISLDNKDILVTIRDNGPGIPINKRERLFLRGDNIENNGKGLGLYLSRIVLESHGGSITLSTDAQQTGAEFIIRIPIIRPL